MQHCKLCHYTHSEGSIIYGGLSAGLSVVEQDTTHSVQNHCVTQSSVKTFQLARQLVKKQTEQTDLPLSHKQSVRHIISNGSCFHLTILIQTIFCRLLRIQKTNTFHSLLCPECIICIWTHRVHFTAFHQLLLLLLVQLTSSSEL